MCFTFLSLQTQKAFHDFLKSVWLICAIETSTACFNSVIVAGELAIAYTLSLK